MPGFDENFYLGVLLFSTDQTILPTPGSHLEDHLKRRSRVVCRVRGDGLIFSNAVVTCLQEDHDITITITITAYVLDLDFYIYQNNQGKIQVLKYSGGLIYKPIYLKFTHNDLNPVENHYDAIIKNQVIIENEDEIIQLKNTSASQEQKSSSNISNRQVFSWPTSNTKVINHQEVNTTIGQGRIASEQIFNNHVENIQLECSQIFN